MATFGPVTTSGTSALLLSLLGIIGDARDRLFLSAELVHPYCIEVQVPCAQYVVSSYVDCLIPVSGNWVDVRWSQFMSQVGTHNREDERIWRGFAFVGWGSVINVPINVTRWSLPRLHFLPVASRKRSLRILSFYIRNRFASNLLAWSFSGTRDMIRLVFQVPALLNCNTLKTLFMI